MGPLPAHVPSCRYTPLSQRRFAPGLKLPTAPQLSPGHAVTYWSGKFALFVRVTFKPGRPDTGSTAPEGMVVKGAPRVDQLIEPSTCRALGATELFASRAPGNVTAWIVCA